MKTENQHGYVVLGAHISLKKINERTKIEVIPGIGKVLYLKLGNETGLTNATSIEDDLKCFIPDHKGNQSSIMKKIIDVFGLELRKGTITCEEFNDLPEDEEFKVQLHLNVLNGLEDNKENHFQFVIQLRHMSKNSKETQLQNDDERVPNFKTHFMLKGTSLSIKQIVEKTNVAFYINEDGKICFRLGTDHGITNARNIEDNLTYVSASEGSNVEGIIFNIAKVFKIKITRVILPIAATSDEILFNDDFYNTYAMDAINQIEEEIGIFSIRSIFTGEPEPGHVSIPLDFLDLND